MAHQNPRRSPSDLSREIAPWGLTAPISFHGNTGALIEDTDPFARLDGKTAGEFYRAAEANCTPLAYGRSVVQNRILAEGWVIEPGSAGGKDAEDLRDWTASWLGRRDLRFTKALPLLASYLFYGWQPYQQLWGDWTWNRSQEASGKRFKVPSRVIEKDPRMFRFNFARDLVFTGFGARSQVFPITDTGLSGELARMAWLTPSTGSEDIPYGRALYRLNGAAAAYLIWRDLWPQWQRGVDRSQGILMAERIAGGVAALMKDDELQVQLDNTLARLNSDGILSPPVGIKMWWLENTAAYAEGWKDPLDRLEALIALAVTGQGLSIGLGRTGSGSRAAAEVEEQRSARWGRGYAIDIAQMVTGSMIEPAVKWNWGDVPEDLRPSFVFRSSRIISAEKLAVYFDLFQGDPSADPPDAHVIAGDWQIPTVRGGEWSGRRIEPEVGGSSHEDDEESSHEDDDERADEEDKEEAA